MSHGIRAGLEIRGTVLMPPASWLAVVPCVDVDEVPNRALFTSLAGHELAWLDLQPLLPARGLPPDVTPALREQYEAWGGSAYDATWLSYEELVTAIKRMTAAYIAKGGTHTGGESGQLPLRQRGASIDAVVAFLAVYHSRGFETRMVFWFTPV